MRSTKAWLGPELSKAEVTCTLSPATIAELRHHVRTTGRLHVGAADRPAPMLRHARGDLEDLRRRLEQVHGFAIITPLPAVEDVEEQRALVWLMGGLLGTPVEQSGAGLKIVQVYDRDRTRRMQDGARYHQTRQGGSIHTDNVNRPEMWDYLIMACLYPAMIGGESIVVSGLTVYDLLRERAPRALEVLAEDFWWECRGFSDDFFRAPVLSFDARGEPQFRYLRDYLESAHRRQDAPLREEQLWALDTLDSALELSALQFRYQLAPGEILVIDDRHMFHGRTGFSDFFDAVAPGAERREAIRPYRRCLDRLWISKRAA